MSSRRRGGSGIGVVAAAVALGCCLSAPAHADFDDLLDTVIGVADAGPGDPGGLPADSGDLGSLGVLRDPLGQLDQLFHDTPGESDGTPTDTDADHEGSGSNNLPSVPKFGIPGTGNGSGSGGGPGGSGGSNGGAAKAKANAGASNAGPAPRPEAMP